MAAENSMALVTSSGVPPPPRMSAPSVSTSSVSSYASAGSGYEFVKPSDLGSDDDGDDDPIEAFTTATAALVRSFFFFLSLLHFCLSS